MFSVNTPITNPHYALTYSLPSRLTHSFPHTHAWSLQSVKPHGPHTLVSLANCPFAQALSCSQWSHPLIPQRPCNNLCFHLFLWSQPQLVSLCCMRSHPPSPAIVSSHVFCLWFSFSVTITGEEYIQSVPLTPAKHSPSPHLCVHPPLLPLVQRASLQLYRSSSPTSIKDLRAPLSTNQVVIRAAKIRGLINKGLSLLAGGSQCLKRWHQSAFWEHQVDARTPGVPWNGKQRQGLALANNAHIGDLLAIFPFLGLSSISFSTFASSQNPLAV